MPQVLLLSPSPPIIPFLTGLLALLNLGPGHVGVSIRPVPVKIKNRRLMQHHGATRGNTLGVLRRDKDWCDVFVWASPRPHECFLHCSDLYSIVLSRLSFYNAGRPMGLCPTKLPLEMGRED